MSALARYYLAHGWRVFGSDVVASEITEALKNTGAKIYIDQRKLAAIAPDLVIHSPAVKKNDPELKDARRLGIKTMNYPQALGELTKKYDTIAVAGAHGKSTTTAMIGLMMVAAKLDPTVIVGTKVKEFQNSNFRRGNSKYLIIEACEYDRSFLNYWPKIIIVTNIEMDHMECYRDAGQLARMFEEFAGHLPRNGTLVACADDTNAAKLAMRLRNKDVAVKTYSIKQSQAGRLRKALKIPGEHNVANGLAALTVGRLLKIPNKTIFASLAKYHGSWRRFDQQSGIIGNKKITVVSDYGHHPTQVKVTLAAARAKWPKKKIIMVYQPHQAWRTYLLFDRFVETLKNHPLDKIFITDIYKVAGRESAAISKKISSQKLAKAIGRDSVEYVPTGEIFDELKKNIKGGEIIIVMGAGNIYNITKQLVGAESCQAL